MRSRRFAAVLLALSLALGSTACKRGDQTVELDFQTAPYYTGEDLPLPLETGELVGCCADQASIWYLAIPGEDELPVLCRVPLDSGEAEPLADYQPPVKDADTTMGYLGPVMGGDGKLWVWEQFLTAVYDLPEGFDSEKEEKSSYFAGHTETFLLRQLDPATGKELKKVDITTAIKSMDAMSLNGLAVDGKGTIYLSDSGHVVAADGQGQALFTLEGEFPGIFFSGTAGGTLALLPDGTVAARVAQSGEEKRVMRAIDRDAKDWGEKKYTIHNGARAICGGSGACMFYYTSNDVFYGVADGVELPQRLISWANTPLEDAGSIMCATLMEEGQAAVLTCSYESGNDRYSGQIKAIRLLPTDEAPDDGKIRLVYAVIGEDSYLQYRIKEFNRNGKYFIELRDYAEGMLGYDENNPQIYNSAVARIYTDIASGQGPDILGTTLPLEALGRQGALEDLWPWIENDPDLGREAVMEHVLECMEIDGKLYRICGSFALETAVASADVAGDRTGWTMEEMLEAYGGEMPEIYFGGTGDPYDVTYSIFTQFDKKSTLRTLLNTGLSRYVDWETGECSFDGEDFKSLLLLSGNAKETADMGESMDWAAYFEYHGAETDVMEPCLVLPWEGASILYARTLAKPCEVVIDDVLFGGRDGLTSYDQRLWDTGALYWWYSPYANVNVCLRHAESPGLFASQRIYNKYIFSEEGVVAADLVIGGADGNVYASYVGFPSESGTGSSFTVYDCAAISAASETKDVAWQFIRGLLLPGGNELWSDGVTQPWVRGLCMNRASFESQLMGEQQWLVKEGTGEYFIDADGKPVEYSTGILGVGNPGPIVMAAFLLPPTQAQLDRFWNLYNAVDNVTGERSDLLDIICEQAEPYFAGDKSLDETVRLIQNRAQLYVNENK